MTASPSSAELLHFQVVIVVAPRDAWVRRETNICPKWDDFRLRQRAAGVGALRQGIDQVVGRMYDV